MDERLEKIDYKAEFGFDKETGEKGVWLDLDSYDYLTQQAEKVEELESDIKANKKSVDWLLYQNKRYKEAIDEICNGESNLEGLDAERELERVTSIAWGAKGESE